MSSLIGLRKAANECLSVVISLVLVIAAVSAALMTHVGPPASACGAYRQDKRIVINGRVIEAEVASTDIQREKGLSGRTCILPDQAMLFTFTQPGQYPFWMKDMEFPIDILWISSAHHVVYKAVDLQPSSYPRQFINQVPAQYVLETRANLSKQLHIGLGTPISF